MRATPKYMNETLIRPGGTPEISRWWNHRERDPKTPSPGGATDQDWSVAPPGPEGSTGLVPVVPPPANLRCASGTKTCAETLATLFAPLWWRELLQLPALAALFSVLLLTMGLTAQGVQAQSNEKELLPDRLGQRWRAGGPARILDGQRLSSLPDADVLGEYGLRRVISRVYTDGQIESSVEVFELNFIPNAYGLFTFRRGQLPPNSREFHEGRYVVRVSSREAGADSDRTDF